jgi:hypothetical protein
MNISRVRIYPSDTDGDPVEWDFLDHVEAEIFARHIQSLPEKDFRFLSGATGSVGPFLRETVTLAQAMRELADEWEGAACPHDKVGRDDDGQGRRWCVCAVCEQEVALSDPDEDGKSYWEVVS